MRDNAYGMIDFRTASEMHNAEYRNNSIQWPVHNPVHQLHPHGFWRVEVIVIGDTLCRATSSTI